MTRARLLDLYCGQGGAGKGYADAGFDVTGVDIVNQTRYPFHFVQADALEYVAENGHRFDCISASPPCQFYQHLNRVHKDSHPDLIMPTRRLLLVTGRPYVIENVPGARRLLHNPIMLCGSMFGLGVWRHRYFECPSLPLLMLPPCNHSRVPVLVSGVTRRRNAAGVVVRKEHGTALCREAMGTPWMTRTGMDEAIPPAYTRFIGDALMAALTTGKDARP